MYCIVLVVVVVFGKGSYGVCLFWGDGGLVSGWYFGLVCLFLVFGWLVMWWQCWDFVVFFFDQMEVDFVFFYVGFQYQDVDLVIQVVGFVLVFVVEGFVYCIELVVVMWELGDVDQVVDFGFVQFYEQFEVGYVIDDVVELVVYVFFYLGCLVMFVDFVFGFVGVVFVFGVLQCQCCYFVCGICVFVE